MGDFIRQYNVVDMSVAVATPNGLITPIIFDSHSKVKKRMTLKIEF